MSATPPLDDLVSLADRLADAAAEVTLRHFRADDLATEDKSSKAAFDPVTVADRDAEAAIRAILQRERPDDGVFGEEHEATRGTSGFTWVIDPIDGTRSFISGLPLWGTLIALDDGRRGVLGVVDQPFTGERFTGVLGTSDGHAELRRHDGTRRIRTRRDRSLSEATLFTTAPEMFSPTEWDGFDRVRRSARLTRYGADCYAYAMLAAGCIDIVIEAGLQAYDIAAPKALIEAAGGVVTDWRGGDCRWGGRVLAAAHPSLHQEALKILADVAPAD